jgi:hypothetical protein
MEIINDLSLREVALQYFIPDLLILVKIKAR